MVKLFKIYFNFILIVTLVSGQCNVEKAAEFFQRSVYEFSTGLVERIADDTENHFVTSAFSPFTLISALSLGASGQTLSEIKSVLRLHPHKCFNKKFFEVIKTVTTANDGAVLERSSTLFFDRNLPIKDEFKDQVERTEVTKVSELSFDNPDAVAATINQYVSEATRNTIEDIVTESDLRGVYIVLIDALYFKGTWKYTFPVEETETSAFYDEQGSQIGDVSLMFNSIQTNYAEIPQLEATVVELPYTSEKYSMLVILPDKTKSLSNTIDNLKRISLKTIFNQFTSTTVNVQLPKFKISSDLDNLKELLIDMGLRTMFDNSLAEFENLSNYQLFVSNFIQKAYIDVNEEGSEASVASAATLMERSYSAPPQQFTANRPFLFTIVDKQNDIVLFTGAYSKPKVE